MRRLYVPPRSRLQLITQHQDHWKVWLGINSLTLPLDKCLGTFISLYPDGRAETTTIYPTGEEEVREVMQPDLGRTRSIGDLI